MRFQIIQKTSEPGCSALRVGPYLDVLVDSLEHGAAELSFRICAMDGEGPLQVQRGIILGENVLSIRYFAHLHVRNRIAALLDISNLCGGIVRRSVKQGRGIMAGK